MRSHSDVSHPDSRTETEIQAGSLLPFMLCTFQIRSRLEMLETMCLTFWPLVHVLVKYPGSIQALSSKLRRGTTEAGWSMETWRQKLPHCQSSGGSLESESNGFCPLSLQDEQWMLEPCSHGGRMTGGLMVLACILRQPPG